MIRIRPTLLIALFGALLAVPSTAQVAAVRVDSRAPVLDGKAFGDVGAYERVTGTLHFALDPEDAFNRQIVDIGWAPANLDGHVEASANFVILQPADPEKRRGTALLEVSNRGGKASLSYFNLAQGSRNPQTAEEFGDGLLMRLGLTVVWVGWQFDVPAREHALRLEAPRARTEGTSPIRGLVRSDWVVDATVESLPLGHRGHDPYLCVEPDAAGNVLTARDSRYGNRQVVPREKWQFSEDGRSITLAGGFQDGKIYELVYVAVDPAIVGMGLAAIRDTASWLKHDDSNEFGVDNVVAVGISQTGRFLRQFLYQGFNTDTKNRRACDGMLILTAGAGRGSFNHRFGQPSRDAHRYSAFFYPTDVFPFASSPQTEPFKGDTDSLLAGVWSPDSRPKTFYVNTGYEYWGRAASLIHTTPDGEKDVPPLDHERIYHLSSCQHFPLPGLPSDSGVDGSLVRGNPLAFRDQYRAMLVRMLDWVETGAEPPASAYPTLADETLVGHEALALPKAPAMPQTGAPHVAHWLDFGMRFRHEGIIQLQPPFALDAYPSFVPQVDAAGNELSGIRNAEVAVPLATYLPWSLRTGRKGSPEELDDFFGAYLPLPRTEAEKEKAGDSRPSIESLYRDRADFLAQTRAAAEAAVESGLLLAEDVERTVERAGRHWDRVMEAPNRQAGSKD